MIYFYDATMLTCLFNTCSGKRVPIYSNLNSDILAPALQHKDKEKVHNSQKNKRIMLPTALELVKKDAMRLGPFAYWFAAICFKTFGSIQPYRLIIATTEERKCSFVDLQLWGKIRIFSWQECAQPPLNSLHQAIIFLKIWHSKEYKANYYL